MAFHKQIQIQYQFSERAANCLQVEDIYVQSIPRLPTEFELALSTYFLLMFLVPNLKLYRFFRIISFLRWNLFMLPLTTE